MTFIDGVDSTNGDLYIIVASSRPDLIDAALLRPGRIEKHIYVGLPSVEDKVSILQSYISAPTENSDIDNAIEVIAKSNRAITMTAADLKAIGH